MTASVLLDVAGRRRSPATLPGYHAGRVPHNKGQTYPADPPTVDEIVPVMRQAPDDRHGYRVRAMIVVLWRAGAVRLGGARADRDRSRRATRFAARPPRQGWQSPRGRDGRLGLGAASAVAGRPRRAADRRAVLRH